jgi:hypothetical protein
MTVALVLACSTTKVTPLFSRGGDSALGIECYDKLWRGDGKQDCIEKANELCPDGFETLSRETFEYTHSIIVRCHGEASSGGSQP